MDQVFKTALGVPPTATEVQQSGGRALVDPIGTDDADQRQYTDPYNVLHKQGNYDYSTGLDDTGRYEKEKEKKRKETEEKFRKSLSGMKKGGKVKSGNVTTRSSASKRGDGIAQRGHTKGNMR